MDCAFDSIAFDVVAFDVCVPVPPTPEPVVIVEPRRWPGPSYLIYREPDMYYLRQRREEEEIIVL
jgi:hypothetical protein